MLNATLWPSPIVPSTFPTGTCTLSSISTVVDEPSSPSFFSSAPLDDAHAALDDERGELLAVDLGEDGEDVGEAAVGDPRLLAVEDVVLAVRGQPRGRLGRERVGAGVRLGQARRRRSARALASRGRYRAFCSSVPK